VCITARLDVTPKTTKQNRIVRTGKSEAEITDNKKLARSIVLLKLTTDTREAWRGLFATAELLVLHGVCEMINLWSEGDIPGTAMGKAAVLSTLRKWKLYKRYSWKNFVTLLQVQY